MTAYAIFEDGGRQFKVSVGDRILIDYRENSEVAGVEPPATEGEPTTEGVGEVPASGTDIVFEQVYAIRRDDGVFEVGQPTVAGVVVRGKIRGVEKGPKLVVQKFRRRKTFRKKTGHRQIHTLVEITAIEG
ncbi:MAG: 50S ribosomal protein L21 [Planctomycetia bacterium]|nr:50S ribosomal protein L21 [Planctomycetia bacterium]